MHMSDALLTPVVGVTMLATGSGTLGYSIRSIKSDIYEKRLPLMGVMGAFLFAAQMINFSIPGTGSSGHIGGALLLAIILGPYAGFLTLATVLFIQALFFADGGLLALGCNLMNMGFFTIFLAYPYVYKKIVKNGLSKKTIMIGSILTAIIGLQLGSLGVVLETYLSGRTQLPIGLFLLFMQPIHLAIGFIEGIVTGIIVNYLYTQNPNYLFQDEVIKRKPIRRSNIALILLVALVIGGMVSQYASSNPDGLEWSIYKSASASEINNDSSVIDWFNKTQEKLAIMPDYSFADDGIKESIGTSVSGIFGSLLTLCLTILVGTIIRRKRRGNERYE